MNTSIIESTERAGLRFCEVGTGLLIQGTGKAWFMGIILVHRVSEVGGLTRYMGLAGLVSAAGWIFIAFKWVFIGF